MTARFLASEEEDPAVTDDLDPKQYALSESGDPTI